MNSFFYMNLLKFWPWVGEREVGEKAGWGAGAAGKCSAQRARGPGSLPGHRTVTWEPRQGRRREGRGGHRALLPPRLPRSCLWESVRVQLQVGPALAAQAGQPCCRPRRRLRIPARQVEPGWLPRSGRGQGGGGGGGAVPTVSALLLGSDLDRAAPGGGRSAGRQEYPSGARSPGSPGRQVSAAPPPSRCSPPAGVAGESCARRGRPRVPARLGRGSRERKARVGAGVCLRAGPGFLRETKVTIENVPSETEICSLSPCPSVASVF